VAEILACQENEPIMGKYDESKFTGKHNEVLFWIANELAEANRLKVLELRYRDQQSNKYSYHRERITL